MASVQCSRAAKLESQDIPVKAPANKFYEMFTCKPHGAANAKPHIVRKADLLEGEWGKEGSIICWQFEHEGKPRSSKVLVEVVDYERKITRSREIEGEFLNVYKNLRYTFQVTPKNGSSLVRWTVEYEKDDRVPDPHAIISWLVNFTKDIDCLLNQA